LDTVLYRLYKIFQYSNIAGPQGFDSAQPLVDAHDVNMLTNHGGISSTLRANRVVFTVCRIFEYVAVCLTNLMLTLLFVVLYRPGSMIASVQFFNDLSDLPERALVCVSLLIVAGDVSHLDDITALKMIKFISVQK